MFELDVPMMSVDMSFAIGPRNKLFINNLYICINTNYNTVIYLNIKCYQIIFNMYVSCSTSLKRRAVLSTPQWTSNLMRTIPQSCMLTYRHSAAPEVMTLTHTESLLGRWCTPHWLATNAEPDCSVSVSFLAWWSQICLCCLDMLS